MNMGVLGLFIYVAYIHMIDKFIEFAAMGATQRNRCLIC